MDLESDGERVRWVTEGNADRLEVEESVAADIGGRFSESCIVEVTGAVEAETSIGRGGVSYLNAHLGMKVLQSNPAAN